MNEIQIRNLLLNAIIANKGEIPLHIVINDTTYNYVKHSIIGDMQIFVYKPNKNSKRVKERFIALSKSAIREISNLVGV